MYIKECPYYADGYANEKQKDVQLEGILLVNGLNSLDTYYFGCWQQQQQTNKHIVQHTK